MNVELYVEPESQRAPPAAAGGRYGDSRISRIRDGPATRRTGFAGLRARRGRPPGLFLQPRLVRRK